MKKEIISIAMAAATACCSCFSPVYAVEETETKLTYPVTFPISYNISIVTPTGDNPRYPNEPYEGNAHIKFVRIGKDGEIIEESGEWYLSELETSGVHLKFDYTMESEDDFPHYRWIIDELDEGYYPMWGEDELVQDIMIDMYDYFYWSLENDCGWGSSCTLELLPNNAVRDESTTDGTYLIYGDANLDGNVTISDSVAILQYIANNEKYSLDDNARANADVYNPGDGITGNDANSIMKLEAGVISSLPETLS